MAETTGYNYAEDLLGTSPASPAKANATSATSYDYASDLLSAESKSLDGKTTVTGAPVINRMPEAAASSGDLAKASFADDPVVRAQFLASKRFPNDPKAIERYGVNPDSGEIYYRADDGNLYSEDQPEGGAGQFFKRNVTANAGKAIPIGLEIGAGVATAPLMSTGVGVAGSAAAVGAAGSAGEIIRQFLGKKMLGDKFSTGEVLKEGGIAAAGQGVGGMLTKYGNRMLARDINKLNQVNVDDLVTKAKDMGIDLTPAEITDLRSLRAQQRTIGRTEEGADILGDFFKNRNTVQIPQAKDRVLSSISPVDQTDVAASTVKEASEDIGNAAVKARSAAVKPKYDALMVPSNTVDIKPLEVDSVFTMALNNVRKDPIYGSLSKAPNNSLPVLDAVKKELDDMIEVAKRAGQGNRARVLTESKEKLLAQTDAAFPEYASVRAEFAGMSPEVTEITKGTIGQVAKSKGGVNDLGTLFDFNRTGPKEIAKARSQFEKSGKIDEWNAGLRAFIQNKWSAAGKETAAGPRANLAGAYRSSIFGDERARQAMKSAMSPEQYEGFSRFMDVLEAAARALPEGSPTATDMAGMAAMRGKAGGAVKAVTNFDITKPLGQIGDWLENKAYGKQAEQIAQIITSPDGMAKLKELRKLTPGSMKARALVGQMLSAEAAKLPNRVMGYQEITPEDMKNLSYISGAQSE
jgi:hypothetical protein